MGLGQQDGIVPWLCLSEELLAECLRRLQLRAHMIIDPQSEEHRGQPRGLNHLGCQLSCPGAGMACFCRCEAFIGRESGAQGDL